jgi:hypothetical protein
MKPLIEPLHVAEHVRQKAASREADARALASGEKSRQELRAENGTFGFPRDRVRIDFSQVKPKPSVPKR